MTEAAAAHLDRARHALKSAQLLLDGEEAEDCISRSYYAALHAARAALAEVGESPKTHTGANNRFWVRFVESERVPKAVGQLLSRAQEMREDADYDAFTRFDTLAAEDLLRETETFVEAVEALVHDLSEDSSS